MVKKKSVRYDNPELDDIVTYYIIYDTHLPWKENIAGWTDDKLIAEFYMEFHNYDGFVMKKIKGRFQEIINVLNNSINEEIDLYSDLKTNVNGKLKEITLPLTTNECTILTLAKSTMLADLVSYEILMRAYPRFNRKYQQALKNLFLLDIAGYVLNGNESEFTADLDFDDVVVLTTMTTQFGGNKDKGSKGNGKKRKSNYD